MEKTPLYQISTLSPDNYHHHWTKPWRTSADLTLYCSRCWEAAVFQNQPGGQIHNNDSDGDGDGEIHNNDGDVDGQIHNNDSDDDGDGDDG